MEPISEDASLSDLIAELQSLRARTAYLEQEIARRTATQDIYSNGSTTTQGPATQEIYSHGSPVNKSTNEQEIYLHGLPLNQSSKDNEMLSTGLSIQACPRYISAQFTNENTTMMTAETNVPHSYLGITNKTATLYNREGVPASVEDVLKGFITKGNEQTLENNKIEPSQHDMYHAHQPHYSWNYLHTTSREQLSSCRTEDFDFAKSLKTAEIKHIKKDPTGNNDLKRPRKFIDVVGATNAMANKDVCEEQNYLTKALVAAAGNGKYKDVQHHLSQGVDIDGSARWAGLQCSALTAAAWFGHENIVTLLLDNEAAVDKLDRHGWSALTLSAYRGHESIVRILLCKGATIDRQDRWGRSALAAASGWGREIIVQLLLNEGASVDLQDHHGNTALISAAKWGKENICRLLLEKDACADIQNKEGHSALTETRRECHDEIVKILNQIPSIPLLQSICKLTIVNCTNKENLQYLKLPNKIIKTLENKALPTFKGLAFSS